MKNIGADAPLVGRDLELAGAIEALCVPRHGAVVVTGPAGVGKTRLCAEIANALQERGFAIARAAGSSAAASIPFGAVAPLLPTQSQAADRLELLLRASSAVLERAAGGNLLLLVDDAHFLDDGSAALVYQLVERRACSVIASVRTPNPVPDAVTSLWKDGLAQRVDLAPLDERQSAQLVTLALGGPVAGQLQHELWELSRGNTLFLRELLLGATASGRIMLSGGLWSLHGQLRAPARLVELVSSRMAGMEEQTVDVVHAVAIGGPLGIDILEKLSRQTAISEAEDHGFIEIFEDRRRTEVRLAHPLYGEALRHAMARSKARAIYRKLAAALQATGARRREDLLRLARWDLDAGGAGGDPVLLGRAARRAAEMFDMDLARRLAERALDCGGDVQAGVVLAESMFRTGYPEQAERVLSGLVPRCQTDQELARVASARAHNLHNLMGDIVAAAAVLEDALARVKDEPSRMQLLGRQAVSVLMEGRPAAALEAAAPLLDADSDALAARGAYVCSISMALLGRGDDAVPVAHKGYEAYMRIPEKVQMPECQFLGAILGHNSCGRFEQAAALARRGYEACLAAKDNEGHANLLYFMGIPLVEHGDLAGAARAFRDAATTNREINDIAALRWCLGGIALAEAMAGDHQAATGAVAELEKLPTGWMLIFEWDVVERGRAWCAAAGGEISRALTALEIAAEHCRHLGQVVPEANLLHDMVRLGAARPAVGRLEELARQAQGPLLPALAAHARARLSGTGAELAGAAALLASCGARLHAAEAACAAAATFTSEGLARRATEQSRLCADLLQACGHPRSPALRLTDELPLLTRREREVATLAASGLASRDIAERLFLSVRTVDNHLQSVYTKLGINNRDDLGRALHRSN